MKAFYKIENNLPIVGSGTVIPEGFTEYEVGQEPTELANAFIIHQEQENIVNKIQEAKNYLAKTDYKFYSGYKAKDGEDLGGIEYLRDEAREFIRANEVGDE